MPFFQITSVNTNEPTEEQEEEEEEENVHRPLAVAALLRLQSKTYASHQRILFHRGALCGARVRPPSSRLLLDFFFLLLFPLFR
jgi:hypothetical protein